MDYIKICLKIFKVNVLSRKMTQGALSEVHREKVPKNKFLYPWFAR